MRTRTIRICHGLACMNNFSEDLYSHALEQAAGAPSVEIEKCHCMSRCEIGPNIAIDHAIHNEMTTELLDQQISLIIEKAA